MKWLRGPLFGNEYGVNWPGVILVAAVGVFMLLSFPWVSEKKALDEVRNGSIVCVKPKGSSDKSWNCWEENK